MLKAHYSRSGCALLLLIWRHEYDSCKEFSVLQLEYVSFMVVVPNWSARSESCGSLGCGRNRCSMHQRTACQCLSLRHPLQSSACFDPESSNVMNLLLTFCSSWWRKRLVLVLVHWEECSGRSVVRVPDSAPPCAIYPLTYAYSENRGCGNFVVSHYITRYLQDTHDNSTFLERIIEDHQITESTNTCMAIRNPGILTELTVEESSTVNVKKRIRVFPQHMLFGGTCHYWTKLSLDTSGRSATNDDPPNVGTQRLEEVRLVRSFRSKDCWWNSWLIAPLCMYKVVHRNVSFSLCQKSGNLC